MFDMSTELTTEGMQALVAALSRLDETVDDAGRIDQLSALERVKSAVAAAQARVTVGFVASQEQIAQGWREHAKACADDNDFDGWRQARDNANRASLEAPAPPDENSTRGKKSRKRPVLANGIAAQVALARHESPHRGSQHVSLALALDRHLPNVLAWLQAGVLSEWRATLIVREAAVLTPALQEALDAELGETFGEGIGRLGDRQLVGHVKAIAYRLDPQSVLNRARKAEGDRRVSLRPAPDTMAYLTALLPVAQAVAAYAALTAAADTARAGGDERGKGQVMADTLVQRLTGQASAQDVEVEVQVVITDEALFGSDETPGQVPGYGTVPAGWVRDLLTPHDHTHDTGPENAGAASAHQDDTNQAGPGDSAAASAADSDTSQARPGDSGAPDAADGDTNQAKPVDADTDSAPKDDTATSAGPERGDGGTPTAARGATGADGAGLREHARVWLRRLYTHPATGQLVGMDSTRRVFDGNLRRFLLARDAGVCRTPWCDAPIRHLDHIHDHALGGPTTAQNGQGLCVRCNHTKQLPGFTARTITPEPPPGTRTGTGPARSDRPRHAGWDPARFNAQHTVELTTPTGHTYPSTAPRLIPGKVPRFKPRILTVPASDPPLSPFERYLTDLIAG